MRKYLIIGALATILLLSIIIWWRYYFVFGEGVKSGDLNYFVKKGFISKTYEGKLIQTGFKTAAPGNIQSNEFSFSVVDEKVALELDRCSGKTVELRYVEYLNSLPWRGMSNYVVIEVVHSEDKKE